MVNLQCKGKEFDDLSFGMEILMFPDGISRGIGDLACSENTNCCFEHRFGIVGVVTDEEIQEERWNVNEGFDFFLLVLVFWRISKHDHLCVSISR